MTRPSIELAPSITLGPGLQGQGRLVVIAGPCAIESAETTLEVARFLAAEAERRDLDLIFKASFDKANRSSIRSFRGPGLDEGLEVLSAVKRETGLPLLTDVHEAAQCGPAAEVCDVLQIPAFLCRQTDLVTAAARTGKPVNLKKGQFSAPGDMRLAAEKVREAGNAAVSVTERGSSFGYNNLVVDMRSFAMLHEAGVPAIYDVTHSLQLPGGGEQTGGLRQYAEPLARAALAAGADGLYLEVHPDPENALSDSTTQLQPARAARLLDEAEALWATLRSLPGGAV